MSCVVGVGNAGFMLIGSFRGMNDDSVLSPKYQYQSRPKRRVDALWPRPSISGFGTMAPLASQRWKWTEQPKGNASRKTIAGIARDSTGTVLGGATIKLFNTATGVLVDTQTADASGNFTVQDPNNVACFIVAYKAGSPDVAGTTLNTLTGT